MLRLLAAGVVAALLVVPAVTAPATKDKKADEPLGPVTDKQLATSANNLKQIAIAFHNYNDTNGELPANQMSKDKTPLLSWRVQILPYIEQDQLYKQFKHDEPWDSDHNKKLIEKIPELYLPVRGKAEKGMTFYQVFGGERGLFRPGVARAIATIPDGSSNTFLVAEAAKPAIWTKPVDMEFDGQTVPALGGMFDGRFHAALGDGLVVRFRDNVPAKTLKLWIDPDDRTPLPADRGEDADAKK